MKTIKLNIMKKLLLFTAVIAVSFTTFAQVGIGTTTPEESAALEIKSTTGGLLPPRMEEAERNAISTPAAGLIVYCTDCGANGELQFYDGTSWWNTESATYQEVTSGTGKTWLDRNLGATQVATSSTDADSYGDLYQWGRNTDGHEKRDSDTSDDPVDDTAAAGTSFITNNGDWLSTNTTSQAVNDARWNSGSEGTPVKVVANDPCPTGYRIPTGAELDAERNIGGTGSWGTGSEQNSAAGAFASVLKLPVPGTLSRVNAMISSINKYGYYWSSTVSGTNALSLLIGNNVARIYSGRSRAFGLSVRCIKE